VSIETELTIVSEHAVRTFRSQQSAVTEIEGVRVHICVKGEKDRAFPLKNAPEKCKSIHELARCLKALYKEYSQQMLYAEVQENIGYTFSWLPIFARCQRAYHRIHVEKKSLKALFSDYKESVATKPEAALHPILVIHVYDKKACGYPK